MMDLINNNMIWEFLKFIIPVLISCAALKVAADGKEIALQASKANSRVLLAIEPGSFTKTPECHYSGCYSLKNSSNVSVEIQEISLKMLYLEDTLSRPNSPIKNFGILEPGHVKKIPVEFQSHNSNSEKVSIKIKYIDPLTNLTVEYKEFRVS